MSSYEYEYSDEEMGTMTRMATMTRSARTTTGAIASPRTARTMELVSGSHPWDAPEPWDGSQLADPLPCDRVPGCAASPPDAAVPTCGAALSPVALVSPPPPPPPPDSDGLSGGVCAAPRCYCCGSASVDAAVRNGAPPPAERPPPDCSMHSCSRRCRIAQGVGAVLLLLGATAMIAVGSVWSTGRGLCTVASVDGFSAGNLTANVSATLPSNVPAESPCFAAAAARQTLPASLALVSATDASGRTTYSLAPDADPSQQQPIDPDGDVWGSNGGFDGPTTYTYTRTAGAAIRNASSANPGDVAANVTLGVAALTQFVCVYPNKGLQMFGGADGASCFILPNAEYYLSGKIATQRVGIALVCLVLSVWLPVIIAYSVP